MLKTEKREMLKTPSVQLNAANILELPVGHIDDFTFTSARAAFVLRLVGDETVLSLGIVRCVGDLLIGEQFYELNVESRNHLCIICCLLSMHQFSLKPIILRFHCEFENGVNEIVQREISVPLLSVSHIKGFSFRILFGRAVLL